MYVEHRIIKVNILCSFIVEMGFFNIGILFLFYYYYYYFFIFTLQYCIGFDTHQHESAPKIIYKKHFFIVEMVFNG